MYDSHTSWVQFFNTYKMGSIGLPNFCVDWFCFIKQGMQVSITIQSIIVTFVRVNGNKL